MILLTYLPSQSVTLLATAVERPSYHEYWWFGALGNGSDIANGDYHFRIAALNPFGDRRVSSDWSIWVDGMPDIVAVNRTTTDIVV